MLQSLAKIRADPLKLMFEPGLLSLLLNPFYRVRSALYRNVAKQAPNFSGDVLDIGCGSKPYEHLFSSVHRYIGIDIEISGHDHKTSKVDVFYDGQTLPFPEGTFDAVVSFETFEHVFNLDDLLDEIHRVLKPNGSLMFSIPFCWPEHEQPFDFARYSSFGITDILNSRGFDVKHLEKSGDFVSAVMQLWVEYLRSAFLPKYLPARLLIQGMLIFPMVVLSKLLSVILPKKYEYYFGLLVVARRIDRNGASG